MGKAVHLQGDEPVGTLRFAQLGDGEEGGIMRLAILSALNTERAARRPAVVVTDLESGAQRIVRSGEVAADPLRDQLEAHLRTGKSGMEETPQGRVFLTVHVPAIRLVDHRRGTH